jgi:hypothetical protein
MMNGKWHLIAAAAAALTFGLAVATANAADVFTLGSQTFQDGRMMPKKVANKNPKNPACIGENVSPELHWSGVPDGTKSFILLGSDPQGGGGAGFSHLVAYGIPASVTSLAEGELSRASDKYVAGKSGFGGLGYGGPCPAAGTSAHHYMFVIIATDFDPKEMASGLTREEVLAKLVPPGQKPTHTTGTSTLVGLFVNPWHE